MEDETLNNQETVQPEVEETENEGVVSPQDTQPDTETPTPEQGENQEEEKGVPFHEHPRWKQVQEEKERLRAENEWFKNNMEKVLSQRKETNVQTPVNDDPYAGMDAETSQFYRNLDGRFKKILQGEISKREEGYKQQISAMATILGEMRTKEFRGEFPDIKRGSDEEREIAYLIDRKGYQPQHAYWAVKGPERAQAAISKAKVKEQTKTLQKRQANLGSSQSVSPDVKSSPKKTFEEELAEKILGAQNLEI